MESREWPLTGRAGELAALMEQQSGIAFDRRWLEQPLPTYRIGDA